MRLVTTLEDYANDLGDVIRLFYGDVLACGDEDGLCIEHTADGWEDRFAFREAEAETAHFCASAQEVTGDALTQKRHRKRACKNALYAFLSKKTGRELPWGSLTGIRPTRMYAEGLALLRDEEGAMQWLADTFFVKRDKAELLRNIAREQALVAPPQPNECDIYVGIPFCPTRCSYCSFAGVDMATGGKWMVPYVVALHDEIEQGALDMRRTGCTPRAVYIGGGTPTTLSPAQMDALLAHLRRLFPEGKEWTVEAGRPDTLSRAMLDVLAAHGVGRISVNPQTFCDSTLTTIGRAHTAQDIMDAMQLVRPYGFAVNMDLIAALPGETQQDVCRSARIAAQCGAANITVHTLAIKRASRLKMQGEAHLPPQEEARAMVDGAAQVMREGGYAPYYLYRQKYMAGNMENVGYTLPGNACLYNIDNMEEIAHVLAFGAGAITKWLYPHARRIERAPNVRDIEQYIQRTGEMARRKRLLMFEK